MNFEAAVTGLAISQTIHGINRVTTRRSPDLDASAGIAKLIIGSNVLPGHGGRPGVSFQCLILQITVAGRHRVTLPIAWVGIDDDDVARRRG